MPEDPDAGIGYYRRAADQGDPTALCNLGMCYRDGMGVPRDPVQAVYWLTRARDAGDPAAAKALASLSSSLQPAV